MIPISLLKEYLTIYGIICLGATEKDDLVLLIKRTSLSPNHYATFRIRRKRIAQITNASERNSERRRGPGQGMPNSTSESQRTQFPTEQSQQPPLGSWEGMFQRLAEQFTEPHISGDEDSGYPGSNRPSNRDGANSHSRPEPNHSGLFSRPLQRGMPHVRSHNQSRVQHAANSAQTGATFPQTNSTHFSQPNTHSTDSTNVPANGYVNQSPGTRSSNTDHTSRSVPHLANNMPTKSAPAPSYTLESIIASNIDVSTLPTKSLIQLLRKANLDTSSAVEKSDLIALAQSLVENTRLELRASKDEDLCKICCDRAVTIVFLECGHLVSCEICAKLVMDVNRQCPICRRYISRTVRTFKA